MFKRMSVLVRRTGDDRATFSRGWEAHAAPVSGLPKVRGYVQNHVEEAFQDEVDAPIRVDGFVELLWDAPEDMAAAFASPSARPMVEDERNFLGHGSGYALASAPTTLEAPEAKLVLALLAPDRDALASIEARLAALGDPTGLIRDDVTGLIAKPGMSPPQPVDVFFHLAFSDTAAARSAGARIAREGKALGLRLGVYRVRTRRFV